MLAGGLFEDRISYAALSVAKWVVRLEGKSLSIFLGGEEMLVMEPEGVGGRHIFEVWAVARRV